MYSLAGPMANMQPLKALKEDGLPTPEIGAWGEEKYRHVQLYASLFIRSMRGKWDMLVYLDLFAGSGRSQIRGTGRIVNASPLLILGIPEAYDYSYTPFFLGRPTPRIDHSDFVEFDSVLDEFNRWIAQHVNACIAEESVPDLWETLQAEAFLSEKSIQEHDDSFFSEAEKVQIKIALVSFQYRAVKQFRPSADQLASIEKQIKYLSDAVDRLNKFDWKGVAISTLIGVCTNLSLDTERGRQLYGLFQQAMTAVSHLLK